MLAKVCAGRVQNGELITTFPKCHYRVFFFFHNFLGSLFVIPTAINQKNAAKTIPKLGLDTVSTFTFVPLAHF